MLKTFVHHSLSGTQNLTLVHIFLLRLIIPGSPDSSCKDTLPEGQRKPPTAAAVFPSLGMKAGIEALRISKVRFFSFIYLLFSAPVGMLWEAASKALLESREGTVKPENCEARLECDMWG